MAVEEEGENDCASKNIQQTTKLSHKKWRRLLKKEKRRVKRQQLAEERRLLEEQDKWRLENDSLYRARQDAKEKAAEKKRLQEEEENKRQEKLWLEREAQAQIAFAKMREREEKKERERLEQERKIKEEWEEEQRMKKEKEEKKKQEIQDKENAVFKELEKPAEKNTTSDSQWHNPLAPSSSSQSTNYGTEQDNVNCSFYLKTGACRFGDRCSRVHPRMTSSVTLMIPHMYQDIRLSQTMLDEADQDTSLEFDDEETYERYKHFFEDVLPEFEKAGNVVQFKVCCNNEPHLRGNVYVQFSSEAECAQAFAAFNGRWYAGRQLSCEYSPVTKWRSAICGFFTRNRCPRGKNCNFLHVYRNPGNAFRNMDRDESPGRTPYSSRGSERSTRDWRHESTDRESNFGDRSSRERRELRRERSYSRNRDYHYDRDYKERRDNRRERSHSRSERKRHKREESHDDISERKDGKSFQRSERSLHKKFNSDDEYDDNSPHRKKRKRNSHARDHYEYSDDERDIQDTKRRKRDCESNSEQIPCDHSPKGYEYSDDERYDGSSNKRKRNNDSRDKTNNRNDKHNVHCKHSGDCDCNRDNHDQLDTANSGKDHFGRDVDNRTANSKKQEKYSNSRSDRQTNASSDNNSSDESNDSNRKISDNESASSERNQNNKRKHKSHKHSKKSKKKHKQRKRKKSCSDS